MKKNISILLIVLCILVISTLILSAEEVKYDFRKTNWGMGIEEIKKIEGAESIGEEKGCLYYQGEVCGFDCCIVYSFVENRLTEANYVFKHTHTNKNGYIDDYGRLKEILIKKYGEPVKDKIIWENDVFKDSKQDWGTAISVGYLWYGVYWETPITEISMILTGDNFKISLGILYRSQELKEWADKIKEEKVKDEL